MSDVMKGVLGTVIGTAVVALCSLFFTPLFRVLKPLFSERVTLEETQALISTAWLFVAILLVAILLLVIWLILIQNVLRQCKRRLSELEGKPIPEPVAGENYLIDRRTGHPLCPKCQAEGKVAYLRYAIRVNTHQVVPNQFHCSVCQVNTMILQAKHFYAKEDKD